MSESRHKPTTTLVEEGPVYTKGRCFRARAEARQRRFRSQMLGVDCQKYGHLLCEEAAGAGVNFTHPAALHAARDRAARGQGLHVARTFANMCSSQALAFNLFAPLASEDGLPIASKVLRRFVADMGQVRDIQFQYCPPPEIFRDRSGTSGVNCEVLLEYTTPKGAEALMSMEVKFVEDQFTACAFRAPTRSDPCTIDVVIDDRFTGCRYVTHKGHAYFERTVQLHTVRDEALRAKRCPFGGELWQLWVDHTLVHAVAAMRKITHTHLGVCAPLGNEKLMARSHIDAFAKLLVDPSSVVFLPLEELIEDLTHAVPHEPHWQSWVNQMRARYMIE
jgi:hypothetical protein